jgi:hypothetical protein
MEMTSEEIIDNIEDIKEVNNEAKAHLKQILRLADLVKFAKWTPDFNENDITMANAYKFVDETKEIEAVPANVEEPDIELSTEEKD